MLTKFQLLLLPVALVFAEVSSKSCIGHGCIIKKRSIDNELETCVPGSKWREDCNLCTCNEQGRIECTQWQCDPDQPYLIHKTISVGRKVCSIGKVWSEHCNTCICLGLERAVCTKYDCQNYNWVYNKLRKRRQTGNNAEKKCTPGTTWKQECNTCFCTENGMVGCTLMACYSDLQRQKRDQAEEEQSEASLQELEKNCEIGTTVKMDCNICYCTALGFACTKRLCHGHEISVVLEE